jgi:hypothetical protein
MGSNVAHWLLQRKGTVSISLPALNSSCSLN